MIHTLTNWIFDFLALDLFKIFISWYFLVKQFALTQQT